MNSLEKQDSLLAAVKANDFEETKRLVDSNGLVVDENFLDYNLLIQALYLGHREIAKFLLDNGCRVFCNKKNKEYSTPLYYAVNYQSLELVKILLHKGASIKDKDANKETALVLAMKNKYFDIADNMLANYSVKNIDINDEDDIMHFHIAVMRNNTKVVATYLYRGININQTSQIKSSNSQGYTPLHFAVEYKAVEAVKLLLSNKANFGLKNEKGSTPLHLAFYLENCKEKNEIINLILSAHLKTMVNPIDKNGISHFHIACSYNSDLKLLKAFLKFKADCNNCVFSNSEILPGYSPLHIAVKYGCKETVKFLLHNKADVNKAGLQGMGLTPLHLSVETDKEIVKLLLKYKADVCATDNENNTAFHKAIEGTQINELNETRKAIIHLLFSVHQGRMKNVSNKWGVSIFHIACGVEKDQHVIENFLKQNMNINACVEKHVLWSNYSALHFALLNGNLKIIQILLKNNISLKMTNSDKHTASYWVCKYWFNDVGNLFSVKLFPTKKLNNVDLEDLQKKLVFIYANKAVILKLFLKKEEMHESIMFDVLEMFKEFLLKEPLNPQTQLEKQKIIRLIEVFKYINIILLVDHGCDINKKSNKNESYLHCVIRLLRSFYHIFIVEIIETLLICGAQVDIEEGENNMTPLMLAAYEGFDEVVDILLKYKADPNKCSKTRETPLTYALGSNKIKIAAVNNIYAVKVADLLLAKGAKVNIKNSGDNTPLHYAAVFPNFYKILLYILERNCIEIVNWKNSDGNTALHIACTAYNLPAVEILLEYGADMNLENKNGMIPSICLILPTTLTVTNFMECVEILKIMELHAIKLDYIGYKISNSFNWIRKSIQFFFDIKYTDILFLEEEIQKMMKVNYWDSQDFIPEDNVFIDLCKRELERMKNIKIDSYTSLYSIVLKNDHGVSKNVNNKYLQEILRSSKMKENFPLYGCILNLQYKKGLKRYKLLKPAIGVLQTLFTDLPNLCYEQILASFTNQELKRLTM